MKYIPYEYQKRATQFVIDHAECGLLLDMGLGKSVITLTAIQNLIDDCDISRALVVAPKKVAETTWSSEAKKWEHLSGLKVVKVSGSEAQRIAALSEDADVYVLGRDNFVWLVSAYKGLLPFDMLVIDELTSFKNPGSQRFKAMRIARPRMKRVVGLTGTPAPNGLMDLWGQIYCLDMGKRLGKSITRYRDTYFDAHRWNNIIVRCDVKKGCDEIIRNLISDICLSMQAKDYLQLPDMIIHDIPVELPPRTMDAYRKFERDNVLEFTKSHTGELDKVLANSAAGLMNKLSQFANGAVYDDEHNVHGVHTDKADKLAEIVEAANGESILVFYQFKHDIPRIIDRLKGYKVEVYTTEKQLRDWNDGKIDVLLAHPASTAYGLNMQQGGHYIVWFGTGWDLELFQQANARLHRQGQRHPVTVYKLICKGTIDERASASLKSKQGKQQSLLDSLNYLVHKYDNDNVYVKG